MKNISAQFLNYTFGRERRKASSRLVFLRQSNCKSAVSFMMVLGIKLYLVDVFSRFPCMTI